jgi:uncharacterized membrane protein YeaQ/YmgE (transglycosylase-associated protein family)
MNLVVWLLIGGVLGWIASVMMRTDPEQDRFMNVVVGVVGALIGGWLIGPLFGERDADPGAFTVTGVLVSLLGAVFLLALVNLFRRGRLR